MKTNHGRTPADALASKRQLNRHELAWAWIKLHRPEVAVLISDEVIKTYPLKKAKMILPESLQKAE